MVTKLLAACTAALFVAGVVAAATVEGQSTSTISAASVEVTATTTATGGAAPAPVHSTTESRAALAAGDSPAPAPSTPATELDEAPATTTQPTTATTVTTTAAPATADVEDHPSVANAAPPTTDPPLQGPYKAPTATAVRPGPCVAATPNGWNLDYQVTLAGGDNWRFPAGTTVTENGTTGTYTEAVRYPPGTTPPATADITIRSYRLIDAGTNLLRTVELPADLVTTVTCGG